MTSLVTEQSHLYTASIMDHFGSDRAVRLKEDARRRTMMTDFWEWLQSVSAQSLDSREAVVETLGQELECQQVELREKEEAIAQRIREVDAEEALLQEEIARCADVIADRWRKLDKEEQEMIAVRDGVREEVEAYQSQAARLAQTQELAADVESRRRELVLRRTAYDDRSQEVDAREAALQCSEGAMACRMRRVFSGAHPELEVPSSGLRAVGSTSRPVVTEKMADDVYNKIAENVLAGLLRRDPRLSKDRALVRSIVQSSFGGYLGPKRGPTQDSSEDSASKDLSESSGEGLSILSSSARSPVPGVVPPSPPCDSVSGSKRSVYLSTIDVPAFTKFQPAAGNNASADETSPSRLMSLPVPDAKSQMVGHGSLCLPSSAPGSAAIHPAAVVAGAVSHQLAMSFGSTARKSGVAADAIKGLHPGNLHVPAGGGSPRKLNIGPPHASQGAVRTASLSPPNVTWRQTFSQVPVSFGPPRGAAVHISSPKAQVAVATPVIQVGCICPPVAPLTRSAA